MRNILPLTYGLKIVDLLDFAGQPPALKVAKNCVFVGITDLFRVVTGLWMGMV